MSAYSSQPKSEIAATLTLLKWFRAFLKSNADEAKDPYSDFGSRMKKPEARRKLYWLVNVAINRKAGIPDSFGLRDTPDYRASLRRDQNRLKDIAIRIRVYQFETAEVRDRFSGRLSDRNEF